MPKTLPTLDAWLQYLEGLHPTSIEMGLDRVATVARRLLDLAGLPPTITVTGTNGKGSTVMSIEVVAKAHGLRVGTYLSPHLLRYNERVRIDGHCVTDEQLIESFEAVEAARQDISLTYFEFGTLGALWLFARAQLSLLVLEVGLGGRLDAVNIVDSRVAVITSIALDHESWLGNTREQVCFEKAGIRRTQCPVVCGDRDPPPNLFALCGETASPLHLLGRDYDAHAMGSEPAAINFAGSRWCLPRTRLLPDNMATAMQALLLANVCMLNERTLQEALAQLVIPGRRQCLQTRPAVYVDVGHNPHAAVSLAKWIQSELRGEGSVTAIVGMLGDKDYQGTLAALVDVIDLWQPVDLAGPRALAGQRLGEVLQHQGCNVLPAAGSPVEGLRKILERSNESDTIIVFGSFYTVSDILAFYANGAHGK
jgi:dihydrofolate synthase/folylpolyglutamate synthase